MEDKLTEVGIAGILAVLILREVFQFLRAKRQNGNGKLAQQIDMLYRWHAPDAGGVQSWKNTDLRDAINRLAAAVDRQVEFQRNMVEELRDVKRTVEQRR